MLVTISFAIGHYLSDRQAYKNQIINSDIKIIVTEILLNEHLKNCNKAGILNKPPIIKFNKKYIFLT
jgi:hypothetical protein